jgi:hypothetical protein
MLFEFYIVNKSFQYQIDISKEQLEESIKSLSIDYDYIRRYKETDKIFVNNDIYDEIIFPEFSVSDFLYMPNAKKIFDRDAIVALSNIIDKSNKTSTSTKEVIDILLNEHNKEIVYGLICLHKISDIENNYLVYDKNNWFQFHRYFLGLYPHNAEYFINECIKYFPDLFFHENNYHTVRLIFKDSPKTIIHYLNELSNNFNFCKLKTNNHIDLLKQFNSISNFDIDASIEGDLSRKNDLTFSFENKDGNDELLYCELHLKLLFDDNRKIVQNRIYFHEGKQNIQNGKILIGHIGKHL